MNRKLLDNRKDLQKYLFDKGYLITTDTSVDISKFPFYGNWKEESYNDYRICTHKDARLHIYEDNGVLFFLIGHAYNPFTMQIEETAILKDIAQKYRNEERPSCIDELTGIFIIGRIQGDSIRIELDCSGMQYGCYGIINGNVYISSHMRLVGDILDLKTDEYVSRLICYRWYKYMLGNYLPGDITCYRELKRIIPNTYVDYASREFNVTRFYPCKNLSMANDIEDYREVIQQASLILHNTMELIPQKWTRPAISLTGGIDSNTTFAAANGNYDKYRTFSYVAMHRETVDAEAAKKISERFNVPHDTFVIPDSNEDVRDFSLYKAIFEHNDGDIGASKDNDNRKKITLINNDVCDVEVKSWISETIRAYAYKYYGRKKFPASLRPRQYTSLYKIFLLNRKLAIQTDKHFTDYLNKTQIKNYLFNYDETDLFVWEMEHGGKCGLNIGVMKSCFDITIPYNNRKLLDLLLRVPLDKRISDQHHMDMKKTLNKNLFDMDIRVVNMNETRLRKLAINLYYIINTKLIF